MTHAVHAFGLCNRNCDHAEPDPEQVDVCRAWLRAHCEPRKTINTRRSSYGLKHDVEHSTSVPDVTHLQTDQWGRQWAGSYRYVTNGAFIAAALLEGYRMVPTGLGSPNAWFNISFRKVPKEAA
jgi:hypothetical protein